MSSNTVSQSLHCFKCFLKARDIIWWYGAPTERALVRLQRLCDQQGLALEADEQVVAISNADGLRFILWSTEHGVA